ncbi:kelch domain-containing protein 9 isoform X1 [Prionailurus viverrinus]|uniref:kelch domain-containing protein 9 isoform X1 n=1 Tax=Prionailurus viverrinus TaxID=61388 RepID=UPI001FF37D27|nr:kelch domain-containing protein 9 isoform X1 [Prionailurus viverrinus]
MALAGSPGGAGWTWRPVARDALLARAFHSCTELRGRFYLVGGLPAGGATEPSGDTVVFDPAGGQAVRLGARGGPRRSHHDAAPVGGRWLCVVGGWDGSRRVATVAALDTERGAWEAWSAAPGSRPPAGLSSHTCTRVSDRELRVAGREGGTRTQRRYGSVYTLRLDPGARTYRYGTPGPAPSPVPSSVLWKSAGEQNRRHPGHSRTPAPASPRTHRDYDGELALCRCCPLSHPTAARSLPPFHAWHHRKGLGKGQYSACIFQKTQLGPELLHIHSYKEEGCHTASRSGHCAALLQTPGPRPGHQLLLFGGCNSAEPEVAGHWSPGKLGEEPPAAPHLREQLARLVSTGRGSRQGPRGLRHHSCSVVGPFAVLFGGETLTRARDTICNDLYIYDTRSSPPSWFHFPCADQGLKRVGHRTCLWNDQLYLVGGFGEDGRTPCPQVCILDLSV